MKKVRVFATMLGIILIAATFSIPPYAEAQFEKKPCDPNQKITTVMSLTLRQGKRITQWCIGTDNEMNPGDSAFIATKWKMGKMEFWIHRCGFEGPDGPADNPITDKKDLRKKIVTENVSGDKSKVVRYEFDAETKKLTVKSFKDGKLIDTKVVEPAENNLEDVPHPGSDLKFGNDDDIALQGGHDFECIADFDPAVGGDHLPINNTALFLSGVSQSMAWMIPIIAGIAGAGFIIRYKLRD